MAKVAVTTLMPSVFGTMCRARIDRPVAPIVRAACTNSRDRSASTWPRISRAV